MEKETVTLDSFTKEAKAWEKKVYDELAQPYGIFAVGCTA